MYLLRIDPITDPLWVDLLAAYRPVSVFHSPAWLGVLSSSYGFEVSAYVLCGDSGEPLAGFPYAGVSDIRGERIVSLPFSDYCDPLVREARHWDALLEPLLAADRPLSLRTLHSDIPLHDERLECRRRARWHYLDLGPALDELWSALDDGARRNVRKAGRSGVEVRPADSPAQLRAFFELHLGVRKRKYGLLCQPFEFFEQIWRRFVETGDGVLLLAWHDGGVVGGTFYLEWMDRLYYKFNASLPAGLPFRPNDLLTWEGIAYGKGKGLAGLDFGLTDWDQEGLVRYKRKFAGKESTISYLWRPARRVAGAEPGQVDALLGEMTRLLTRADVPDHVTERAGETLYRYFA